jgi:uncharacterized protein (TIGR03435 family)
MLITQAYGIMPYQLSGPDWMDFERFDVTAKVPPVASMGQFRAMLRNLLVDRFQLVAHRGSKDARVYDLVAAKGGPRLKDAAEGQPEASARGSGAAPANPGQQSQVDKDGYPVLSPDCTHCMRMADGKIALRLQGSSTDELAEVLSGQMGQPVRNATGLRGKYDIELRFDTMERTQPAAPESAASASAVPVADLGVPITAALESQLGLRLEPKRAPVDAIIVDSVQRRPSAN